MIVYLAGDAYAKQVFKHFDFKFNRLDSFFYCKESKFMQSNIEKYHHYMLDSGAFTFITAKKQVKVDIDSFTDEYIDYINRFSIELFFEMDVDKVFGYEKVKELRKRIESRTGKQSIPVFHMNRGLDDWKAMCKDYDYIALGIGGKDFAWGDYKSFYPFVMEAKSYGCKTHGLGITGMRVLETVPFTSVDSSSWTNGNRYKTIFQFDGKRVTSMKVDLRKKKIVNHEGLAIHNFKQWMNFSRYMSERQLI